MHQAVSHHLVLALEPFTTERARAAFDRTVMRPVLGMHIRMRAISDGMRQRMVVDGPRSGVYSLEQILRLKWRCRTARMCALVVARGPIHTRGGAKGGSIARFRWDLLDRRRITRRGALGSHR